MKKRNFLVPLLILLAYFVIGTITIGCSEYTCPTYSNANNAKTQTALKSREIANYSGNQKINK